MDFHRYFSLIESVEAFNLFEICRFCRELLFKTSCFVDMCIYGLCNFPSWISEILNRDQFVISMFITADRRCLVAITPTDPRHYFLTSWLHAALQNQMAFLLRAFVAICSVEKNLILNNFSLQLQRKYAQTNNNKQNKTISARKQHPICLWLL